MVLAEANETRVEEDGVRHDLLDCHAKASQKSAEAVYVHIEQVFFFECERKADKVDKRRGDGGQKGDDEIELNALDGTPQRLEHFAVEQDDEPVGKELDNVELDEAVRDQRPQVEVGR